MYKFVYVSVNQYSRAVRVPCCLLADILTFVSQTPYTLVRGRACTPFGPGMGPSPRPSFARAEAWQGGWGQRHLEPTGPGTLLDLGQGRLPPARDFPPWESPQAGAWPPLALALGDLSVGPLPLLPPHASRAQALVFLINFVLALMDPGVRVLF